MPLPNPHDPLQREILGIAEDIKVRAKLLTEKAYLWDTLLVVDTRRERFKMEIRDELGHIRREMRNLLDMKDNLSKKAQKLLDIIEKDVMAADRYLDDDWPAMPFAALVDDTRDLYEEVLI